MVVNSLLQWPTNAPLSTRGPSTYNWVAVSELVVVEVAVEVGTCFPFVHAAATPPAAARSSVEPLHVRQNQGWQS